ncbi:MAG: NAD-dependent epimerase/dehydratase family protein [Methylococcales bacterium]|nr:NAD-dependent epimerase/dehydratase family protein [Methylococcales bacterium]
MKKVLITGTNGFIGRILWQHLQALSIDVVNLVRNNDIELPNKIILDLTHEWAVNPCDGVDTVFHLAGKAHALSEISQDRADYHRINTEGTQKLLEAAQQAGVVRFIYFSSVKAVGDSESMQNETSERVADTPYGHSKFAAEHLVLHGGYVPHPVVIRPCMVYGNSDKGNLPKMIKAIARGFFPSLPEVNNRRSMVHVEDVVRAALLTAENPKAAGQIYIVSDGHPYSSRQLYELICLALDKRPARFTIPLIFLEALAFIGDLIGKLMARRFIFDSEVKQKLLGSAQYSSAKIDDELGFKAQYSLHTALADMVYYLKNKEETRKIDTGNNYPHKSNE